jgi:hypothetical protein
MAGKTAEVVKSETSSTESSKFVDSGGWANYGMSNVSSAHQRSSPLSVKGGVLVFFPSYAVMDSVAAHWRQSGVFDRLRSVVGSVLVEPSASAGGGAVASQARTNTGNSSGGGGRGQGYSGGSSSGSFSSGASFMLGGGGGSGSIASGGYSKGKGKGKSSSLDEDGDADAKGADEFRSIVGLFEHSIKTYSGCVLLAVCR